MTGRRQGSGCNAQHKVRRDFHGSKTDKAMINRPQPIKSLQNERVKAIRALNMRKVRRQTGLFVAEGASVMVSAHEQDVWPETVVFRDGAARDGVVGSFIEECLKSGVDCLEVSQAVLEKLASKDNPQALLGVYRQRWAEPPEAAGLADDDVWVVLETVRDPGNLGTIIRTVDAVGASGVILVGQCCDPYSRECVRATMGSIFSVPLVSMSAPDFLAWRQNWAGSVVGLHLDGAQDFRTVQYSEPVLVVMGSEGPGLSKELTAACNLLVKIPMAGQLDSLNLAVATALTLYEIRKDHLQL